MSALSSPVSHVPKPDGVRALRHLRYRAGVKIHYASDGVGETLCGLLIARMIDTEPIWDDCPKCAAIIQSANGQLSQAVETEEKSAKP